MKDDMKKTLCELQDRAVNDIKNLLAKPEITPTEWKSAGEAVDIIKDVEKAIKDATTTMAMESEYIEEPGSYERGYRRGGYGYGYGMYPEMYEGYGGGRRRNSMGQYMAEGSSNRSGNSYMTGGSYGNQSYRAEMGNAVSNLRNLMNNATNENERMLYQRLINEAEQYNR